MLLAPDAAERRDPDHGGHLDPASGALAVLREVADHLVECGVREALELHLGDRAPPGHREADADPGDPGLGDRRVEHALAAELGLQALGHAEDPAERTDVFAEHERAGMAASASRSAA